MKYSIKIDYNKLKESIDHNDWCNKYFRFGDYSPEGEIKYYQFYHDSIPESDHANYALPIPSWNPAFSGDEVDSILEFLKRDTDPVFQKYIDQKYDEIGAYELLEFLDASHIYRPNYFHGGPNEHWSRAWQEDRDCQIGVMADDWLTLLENHKFEEMWDVWAEEDMERYKQLQLTVVVVNNLSS